jgi:dephospho-CoA kinase
MRIALTGGIATGKSRCLEVFAALGVPVVDADELARIAVDPGTPGFHAVRMRFGPAVIGADGTIDRAELGRLIFADAASRRDLEAIVHPKVYAAVERWFDELERWSGARLAIADIPLLFETGRASDFDRVVVVTCTPEQQLDRLMRRNHLSGADARARIAAQAPLAGKVAKAHFVIDTSGRVEDTAERTHVVWEALKGEASP